MYLTIKELQALTGSHYETARREYHLLRIRLGVRRKVTVREYCEAEDVPWDDVVEILNSLR